MAVFRGIVIVLLAALVPFLYERYQVLFDVFYNNAPERLPRVNALGGPHQIRFADRLRSCEDAILLERQGLALTACDPGRERWNTVMGIFHQGGDVPTADLYLFNYADPQLPDAEALQPVQLLGFHTDDGATRKDLHTLGMALHEPSQTLFVCNHARAGSRVEVFRLDAEKRTATHLRTVIHPLIRGPNSIAVISDSEFYVTNDHRFLMRDGRLLSQLETYLRFPTGTVVHVKLEDDAGVTASVAASLPYANGVEFLNSTTLAVASTSMAAVYLYEVPAATPADYSQLALRHTFRVPFMADNLSVASRSGKLLIAGHGHPPTTFRFAGTRRVCNDPAELAAASDEMRAYCATATAVSWVSEWSETEGLKHLYVDTEYPSSATAAVDEARGVGIIAGLYAKGLLVWRK